MHWGLVISLFQGLRYLKNKEVFWGFFGVFFFSFRLQVQGKKSKSYKLGSTLTTWDYFKVKGHLLGSSDLRFEDQFLKNTTNHRLGKFAETADRPKYVKGCNLLKGVG